MDRQIDYRTLGNQAAATLLGEVLHICRLLLVELFFNFKLRGSGGGRMGVGRGGVRVVVLSVLFALPPSLSALAEILTSKSIFICLNYTLKLHANARQYLYLKIICAATSAGPYLFLHLCVFIIIRIFRDIKPSNLSLQ